MNHGHVYRERLPPQADGRRALEWLSDRYRHSSRETWAERLDRGELALDGAVAAAEDVLRPGQWLAWTRPPWQEPQVPLSFAVLHRDPHVLAVAKPRGTPTLPNGGFLEHTLLHQVRTRYEGAVPLHRLGRGTSGLVLFARRGDARRRLAADWRLGRVEKEYLALVSGRPASGSFSIDVPIGPVPHPRLGTVHAATGQGRPSLSHVRVLGARADATLVAVTIPTGRPHQIRIHLAASGHPLVGDPLYVAGGGVSEMAGLPGDGGYWLHAWRLRFDHPASGARLALECPPPAPLR